MQQPGDHLCLLEPGLQWGLQQGDPASHGWWKWEAPFREGILSPALSELYLSGFRVLVGYFAEEAFAHKWPDRNPGPAVTSFSLCHPSLWDRRASPCPPWDPSVVTVLQEGRSCLLFLKKISIPGPTRLFSSLRVLAPQGPEEKSWNASTGAEEMDQAVE